MFKTSGAMSRITDKELLMSIWGIYAQIDNTQRFFDVCLQRKGDEFTREWYVKMEGKQITKPMQLFYSSDIPHQMVKNCDEVAKQIKEVLLKLEKK